MPHEKQHKQAYNNCSLFNHTYNIMLKTAYKPIYNSNLPNYHQKYESDIRYIQKNMNIQQSIPNKLQAYDLLHPNTYTTSSADQFRKCTPNNEKRKYQEKYQQSSYCQNQRNICRNELSDQIFPDKISSKFQYKQKLKYQPKLYKQNNFQNQKKILSVKTSLLSELQNPSIILQSYNYKKCQYKNYQPKNSESKNCNSNCYDIKYKEDYKIHNKIAYKKQENSHMLHTDKKNKNCDSFRIYDEETQSTISSPQRSEIQNKINQNNQNDVSYAEKLCQYQKETINLEIYGQKFAIFIQSVEKVQKKLNQVFPILFQLERNRKRQQYLPQMEIIALKLVVLDSICAKISQNEKNKILQKQFNKLKQELIQKYIEKRLQQSFNRFN